MIFETKRKWTVVDVADVKTRPPQIGGDRYDCLYKLVKNNEVVLLRNCRTDVDGKIDAECGGPFDVARAIAWSRVVLPREILRIYENQLTAHGERRTNSTVGDAKHRYLEPLYTETEVKDIFMAAKIRKDTFVIMKHTSSVNRKVEGVICNAYALRSHGFEVQTGKFNLWRRLGRQYRLVILGPGDREEFRSPAKDDKFKPGETTIIGEDKP